MFDLTLVSFFTEMGYIQKKAKQFYSKKKTRCKYFLPKFASYDKK